MGEQLSVIDTLKLAERELAFLGGCTHTDRPDLPLSPETSWTTDVSGVLAAIANAIQALSGPRTDPECAGCSNCQQTQRDIGPATREAEHDGSRRAEGGCS